MTETETDAPQMTYRAMTMLTEKYPPRVKGRDPYWRPKVAPVSALVRLPAWDWQRDDAPEGPTVAMDVNAAYLAACSSAQFGHGALYNTGPDDFSLPGLYLIDAHPWTHPEIVSPLGTQPFDDDRVWVAQPTARLLDQLSRDGYWPAVQLHDAWTAATSCRLRRWTDAVSIDRSDALRGRAEGSEYHTALYEAIKVGYAAAVQMMPGPAPDAKAKSPVRRPDWYQTVHAQHAASTWRKVWRSVLAGHGPVAMGSVDEARWTVADLEAIQTHPEPLFRIDNSGHQIGAFKIKTEES